jgi:hypothetical protein
MGLREDAVMVVLKVTRQRLATEIDKNCKKNEHESKKLKKKALQIQ